MLKKINMVMGASCMALTMSSASVLGAVTVDPVVITAAVVGAALVQNPLNVHQDCGGIVDPSDNNLNLNSLCHTCIGFLKKETELVGLDFNAGFSIVPISSSENLVYCIGNIDSNVDQLGGLWEKKLKNKLGGENAACYSDTVIDGLVDVKLTACIYQ